MRASEYASKANLPSCQMGSLVPSKVLSKTNFTIPQIPAAIPKAISKVRTIFSRSGRLTLAMKARGRAAHAKSVKMKMAEARH